MEKFPSNIDDLKRMLEEEMGEKKFLTSSTKPLHTQIDELTEFARLYTQKPLYKEGTIITQKNHERYKVPVPGQPAIVLATFTPEPRPDDPSNCSDTIIGVFVRETIMTFSVDSTQFIPLKE